MIENMIQIPTCLLLPKFNAVTPHNFLDITQNYEEKFGKNLLLISLKIAQNLSMKNLSFSLILQELMKFFTNWWDFCVAITSNITIPAIIPRTHEKLERNWRFKANITFSCEELENYERL